MSATEWNFGDRVVHTGKPEWGTGVVNQALGIMHEGKPCQRLMIRFDRAGLKTISTAFAELRGAEGGSAEPGESGGATATLEAEVDDDALGARLVSLPEPATDPFTTPEQRLTATLDLYRFESTGGSLLDWAAVLSGLRDPLSRFNRHELEAFFERFARTRDEHLRMLVEEVRRRDAGALASAVRSAPAGAGNVLRRLNASR